MLQLSADVLLTIYSSSRLFCGYGSRSMFPYQRWMQQLEVIVLCFSLSVLCWQHVVCTPETFPFSDSKYFNRFSFCYSVILIYFAL